MQGSAHVTIHADSDQRTRETGKALAAGLFPGCTVPVQALPEGVEDPLFHSIPAGVGQPDPALAVAALSGRIGGNPDNLTGAYRAQIAALDQILASGGTPVSREVNRTLSSKFRLNSPREGVIISQSYAAPLNTASTITENFLLEYTQGMDASSVGWGCVSRRQTPLADRTPYGGFRVHATHRGHCPDSGL